MRRHSLLIDMKPYFESHEIFSYLAKRHADSLVFVSTVSLLVNTLCRRADILDKEGQIFHQTFQCIPQEKPFMIIKFFQIQFVHVQGKSPDLFRDDLHGALEESRGCVFLEGPDLIAAAQPFLHLLKQTQHVRFTVAAGKLDEQPAGILARRTALVLDRFGESVQAENLSDGGTGFANSPGKVFMGVAVVRCQALEGFRFLDRRQVLPLQVFDKGDFLGIAFGQYGGNSFESGHQCCPVPPFPGNKPDFIICILPNQDRLQHPSLPDGFAQVGEGLFIEVLSRLIRIDGYQRDINQKKRGLDMIFEKYRLCRMVLTLTCQPGVFVF